VEDQTRQALENLSVVLKSAGSSMASVLQARVFLRDFDDFESMDAIFTEFLGNHRPARTTIPCPGFPEALKVEIDIVAALEPGG
jgi:2-iminobutanoate/2-iminopropanoate deaminase